MSDRTMWPQRRNGRTRSAQILFFLLFAFIGSKAAAEPVAPVEPAPAPSPASPPAPKSAEIQEIAFPVQVTLIDEKGARSPAKAQKVMVEAFRRGLPAAPMMRRTAAEPTLLFKKEMHTNDLGILKIPLTKDRLPSFLRLNSIHQGTTFRSEDVELTAGAAALDLYATTTALGELKADVVASIAVEESYLQTETYVRFSTRGLKAVNLGDSGLPVGFLGLHMGDSALNSVITSEKFDHMQAKVHTGLVRLLRDSSGFRLTGVVTPGKPALVRVAYPIPHLSAETKLAAAWVAPLGSLRLDLRSPARYIAKLNTAHAGTSAVSTEKGVVLQNFEMSAPLSANELFSLRVSSLPVNNPVWRISIAWLCFGVLFAMILLWFHFAREEALQRKQVS